MKQFNKVSVITISVLLAVVIGLTYAFAGQSTTDQSSGQSKPGEHHRFGKGHGEHGFGDRAGEHRGWGDGRIFERLNLTDSQKEQMKQLQKSFAERTKSLRDELRTKHEELRQAGSGGTFNESLVAQKRSEIASLETKLDGERFKLRQDSMALLTPEQKTQLEQMRAEMKKRHEEFKTKGPRQHPDKQ